MLAGCTVHYKPNPSTFKLDAIKEFTSDKAVTLINDQSSSTDVVFFEDVGKEFVGNRKDWTDSAITIAQRELSARGMKVEKNAAKRLMLRIETIKKISGFAGLRSEIDMKVETGDGYVQTYLGDNISPLNMFRAADGAVMRVVTEMLRDQVIIEYLQK